MVHWRRSGSPPRVRERRPGEQGERGVVVDVSVADDAAVAVRCVLVQAHVGQDGQAGNVALEGPHRLLQRAGVTREKILEVISSRLSTISTDD